MPRLITVIPTLNAVSALPTTLERVAEAERVGLSAGLVISDAGSSDGTIAVARRAGARVLSSARGRGAQLASGAVAASRYAHADDWFLFLHADTRPETGWTGVVGAFIGRNTSKPRAAHFRFALDDVSHRARRLERAVNWRCRTFGLPYGDQGLLIRRDHYEALGGYKPWPLFEDVDLVRQIGRRNLNALPIRAVTSADRFQRDGYMARSAKNLTLLARYYLGESPHRLARIYQ